jgi:predicted lipid-binding transport protein (Tim44 family)
MKSFALLSAAVLLGFSLVTGDAEAAKRLGSGKSSGMQRESVTAPQKSPAATPAPAPSQAVAPANKPQAAPGAAQPQPKRSWMGPLAGLAAGLGLAALASHFGFGEELASMLMIGLLVMAVIVVIGFIMRRRAAAAQGAGGQGGMQYAGAGAGVGAGGSGNWQGGAAPVHDPLAPVAGGAAPVAAASAATSIPAGFDVEGFVRNAKVYFIRLQAANDAGNLEDVREFTSPEMFAEIKMAMAERAGVAQTTDVVAVDAEVLDVAEEGSRYIVSVRFSGLIREAQDAGAEPFDEIWHMVKPVDGSRGWTLAGIQQVA